MKRGLRETAIVLYLGTLHLVSKFNLCCVANAVVLTFVYLWLIINMPYLASKGSLRQRIHIFVTSTRWLVEKDNSQ